MYTVFKRKNGKWLIVNHNNDYRLMQLLKSEDDENLKSQIVKKFYPNLVHVYARAALDLLEMSVNTAPLDMIKAAVESLLADPTWPRMVYFAKDEGIHPYETLFIRAGYPQQAELVRTKVQRINKEGFGGFAIFHKPKKRSSLFV